jgi:hypothetical protein
MEKVKGSDNEVCDSGYDAERSSADRWDSESDSQSLSDSRDFRNAAIVIIAVLVLHCLGVIRAVECDDINGADEIANRREGRLR